MSDKAERQEAGNFHSLLRRKESDRLKRIESCARVKRERERERET